MKAASTHRIHLWETVGVVTILTLLFWLLSLRAPSTLFLPVETDARQYLECAQGMRWFWDSGVREPLHVALVKIMQLLVADASRATRLTSVVETFIAALVVYAAARRWLGIAAAQVAVLLFAASPVVTYYAFSGLRAPLWTAVLLLFALALFAPVNRERPWPALARVSVAAALVILTRVYGLVIVVCAFGFFLVVNQAWRAGRRWLIGFAAAAVAIAFAIYAPHALFRPPGALVANDVDFWRNLENTGRAFYTPGGSDVSGFEFFFLEHSLWHIVRVFTLNTGRFLFDYVPRYLGPLPWLWPALIAGIVVGVRRGRGFIAVTGWLTLAPVLLILHLSQMPGSRGIESRFVYQSYAFAALLIAFALSVGVRALWVRASPGVIDRPWFDAVMGPERLAWRTEADDVQARLDPDETSLG